MQLSLWSFSRSKMHNEKSDKPKMRHTEHNVWKCSSNKECILNKRDKTVTGMGALHSWHRMASFPVLRSVSTTATHIQNMLRGKKTTTVRVFNVKGLVDILWDFLNRLFWAILCHSLMIYSTKSWRKSPNPLSLWWSSQQTNSSHCSSTSSSPLLVIT